MIKVFRSAWGRVSGEEPKRKPLDVGLLVTDGEVTRRKVTLEDAKRTEHIGILGKTGSGKSFFLRSLCAQDIEQDRGFVYFDLHGDATPFILRRVAEQERKRGCDLSRKLIVIDPADEQWSVGINILETGDESAAFVRISEFAAVLKHRWHLDTLGARSEELLRNSLYVLWENRLTLLEIAPILVNHDFRAGCVSGITNPEIKDYFVTRYDALSEPMQKVVREPILTKISAFTGDPRFRHIIGQQRSTFSIADAMENGYWVVLNLHKGRLGEETETFGSLFLSMIKYALFARKNRDVFTLYCDEAHNLVTYESGLDDVLSEARKFGISVVLASQFLEQYPPKVRAATLALGTHTFFELASMDAPQIAAALDGGKMLAERLKNLPRRHFIFKSGIGRAQEVRVAEIADPATDYSDLYQRCRWRWANKRDCIENDISKVQTAITSTPTDKNVPQA